MTDSIILKKINFTKPTSYDEINKTLKCVISTQSPDRSNDIIITDGIDCSNFDKTGANVLFNHNPDLIIGHSLWEQKGIEGLVGSPQFDEDDPLAMNLWNKAIKRTMGWSVRLNCTIWQDREDAQYGILVSKSDLIEYSLTPIPDNPDCITKSLIQECLQESTVDVLKDYYSSELKYYDLKDQIALIATDIEKVKSVNHNFEDIIKNTQTNDNTDLIDKYKDLDTKHSELFDKIAEINEFLKVIEKKLNKGDELKKQKAQINKLIINSLKK